MTFQNCKKMDTNIKKSKIKYLILAAVALLVIPSCSEDLLDEQPIDFLSPDNAYQTEAGALQGITAIHDRVRAAYYSFGEFGVMNWATHGSDLGYNGEIPAAGTLYLNSYNDMTPVWRNVVDTRSEEHTSELQSRPHLVCRLLLE